MHRPICIAITGASGAVYAVRLLDVLLRGGRDVQLTISPAGCEVLRHELDLPIDLEAFEIGQLLPNLPDDCGRLSFHHHQDYMARMASGSSRSCGMVVCPCSGGTLSAIARGASGNLIQRAAAVHLKERWPLILVTRETPLALPMIDNMRLATEAGAIVLPASPGWYHGAHSIDALVDFVVARICDQLGVENDLIARWGE